MARTFSFRIPDDLARRVARHTARWDTASDSEKYRRVIEEWVRLQEHPGIRFLNGPAGRRAALEDGPDVWEVVAIARSFDLDAARIAEAYPWLTREKLEIALSYYRAHGEEIDARIEENQRAAEELEQELQSLER
jgi:hypothetical protein